MRRMSHPLPSPHLPHSPPLPSELQRSAVPTLQRYLRQLDRLLDLAQAHVHRGQADEAALLAVRLTPDMLPLRSQVWICGNFIPRMTAVLLGGEAHYPAWSDDLTGMRQQVAALSAQVAGWPAAAFASPERLVEGDAGQAWLQMPLRAWIHEFALPNFFFHLSAVYFLLRQQGVPLGKADFDGLHRYGEPGGPAGR